MNATRSQSTSAYCPLCGARRFLRKDGKFPVHRDFRPSAFNFAAKDFRTCAGFEVTT